MAQKIITLGHQTRQYLVRGTSTTLTGDFREIRFPVSFVMNAVNGTPKIRITVSQVGRGFPEQIRIELIPPERTGLSLTGHRVRASDLRATCAPPPHWHRDDWPRLRNLRSLLKSA